MDCIRIVTVAAYLWPLIFLNTRAIIGMPARCAGLDYAQIVVGGLRGVEVGIGVYRAQGGSAAVGFGDGSD